MRRKPAQPKPVKVPSAPERAWPVVWNGGPAEPVGAPTLSVEFACRTVSETNTRGTWGKVKRKKEQRDAVEEALGPYPHAGRLMALYDSGGPFCIRITRISPGRVDCSNLPPSIKAVEDALAFALGVDDGSVAFGICWAQEQRKGGAHVRIEVWGPNALPEGRRG